MKFMLGITTFLLVIFGCTMEKMPDNCQDMSQNGNFTTIPFKEKTSTHSGYTIQFPNDYSGDGLTIQEWVSFEMASSENTKFYFNYFCAVDCHLFFGSELNSPIPNNIVYPDSNFVLDERIDFCVNDEIEAILYHDNVTNASGILYMRVDSNFYEGLSIYFKDDKLNEVISIIKTIEKTE